MHDRREAKKVRKAAAGKDESSPPSTPNAKKFRICGLEEIEGPDEDGGSLIDMLIAM